MEIKLPKKKVKVEKQPTCPEDCKFAEKIHDSWYCSLVLAQMICTQTVGAPCCLLEVESESE